MGNIVLLDDLTINKIAAGEVIERPASVIKEMVENSIDAGAKNISVEIKNGGISYIRISDDGKGIARDDVEMAFERHATSKIRSAADLVDVKSMGFRGEALASIAAIATVELVTKTADAENGTKIVVEGGDVLIVEDSASQRGTSITVRNLFFNTPVRYKFLKKDYTEAGYIEDVLTRIALVHPEIAIKLINTGKTIIQTNGSGDLKNVIYSIYGKQITEEVLNVNYNDEEIKISGVIGKPAIARSNRSNQIFFVNKRYVKDKTLTAAAEQAFKGLIPIGKFGFIILNIEMDPSKVDVNVHPAKLEVRFSEEDKIFKAMYHAVKETLLNANLISDREKTREANIASKDAFKMPQSKVQTNFVKGLSNLFRKKDEENEEVEEKIEKTELKENEIEVNIARPQNKMTEIKEEIDCDDTNKNEELESSNVPVEENEINYIKDDEDVSFDEMYKKMFGTAPTQLNNDDIQDKQEDSEILEEISTENSVSVFEEQEQYQTINYKFIGIAFRTYIILEIDNEIYIMDQHAAHERILYERVKRNYYSNMNSNSQLLLLPDIINLTHKEMELVIENKEMFEKAGFMLEEFGENTIKLSGVPDICIDLETEELFMETLDEITAIARTAKQEKEERFLATVACKAAVKANMALTKEEVDSLMQELEKLPNPFSCPHGRPTVIKMSKYDIERKFERK